MISTFCRENKHSREGRGGATRVGFGWVSTAQVSKFGTRFRTNVHSSDTPLWKLTYFDYSILGVSQFFFL